MFLVCISSDFEVKSTFSVPKLFAKVNFIFLINNFKWAEAGLSGSGDNAWLLFVYNV